MKFLLIVVALCGVTQALVPTSEDRIQRAIDDGIDVIQKAGEEAKLAIATSTSKMQDARDQLNTIAELTSRQAKANIDAILGFHQLVTDKANLLAASCTEDMHHLGNVGVEKVEGVVACATDKIKEMENLGKDMEELGSSAISLAPNGIKALKACRGGEKPMLCIATQMKDATVSGVKIGAKGALDVTKAVVLVSTLPAALPTCAVGKVIGMAVAVAMNMAKVGGCVVKSFFVTT